MNDTKLHRIVLEHMDGSCKGDAEIYLGQTITVGRAMDCDLHFPNEKSTSPHHAVLRQVEGKLEVLDTQSTNGTFLNEARVEQAQVKDGDTLRFGILGPSVKVSLQAIEPAALPDAALPAAALPGAFISGAVTSGAAMPGAPLAITALPTGPEPAWRFVRNAVMLYIGGSVAAVGVADAVFDRYNLNAKWFSVFLVFLVGGLVSTIVEAWYRAQPGRQAFVWWEGAVHAALIAACTLVSVLVLRAF
jgi:hypothetical protein